MIRPIISTLANEKPISKASILDEMCILIGALDQVSNATIVNCFKKAEIYEATQTQAINDDDDDNAFNLKASNNADLASDGLTADSFGVDVSDSNPGVPMSIS